MSYNLTITRRYKFTLKRDFVSNSTQSHSQSHHVPSVCLLAQLAQQGRHFKIRHFMLRPRWWHLEEILYFSPPQKKWWKKWEIGLLIWIRMKCWPRACSLLNAIISEVCSRLVCNRVCHLDQQKPLFFLCCTTAYVCVLIGKISILLFINVSLKNKSIF